MVESKRCGLEGVVAEAADVMVVDFLCFVFCVGCSKGGPWAPSSSERKAQSAKSKTKHQHKNKNHDAELPQ